MKAIITIVAVLVTMMVTINSAKAISFSKNSLSAAEEAAFSNSGFQTVATNFSTDSKIGIGAQDFVENMGQRALKFLGSQSMSPTQKSQAFGNLLRNSFDMKTIGRFSLGRYWRVATEKQRATYQKLFRNMVIEVYTQRFDEYKGQDFETRTHRFDGKKDTMVTSFIVQDHGADVQVDWRVRYKNGKYKIVDVIVEGVSMSVTQRSDFSAVIQRGGGNVEVLLAHLRP